MENRKDAIAIVRECMMFVLRKKVLEPDLKKINLQSVVHCFVENLTDPV